MILMIWGRYCLTRLRHWAGMTPSAPMACRGNSQQGRSSTCNLNARARQQVCASVSGSMNTMPHNYSSCWDRPIQHSTLPRQAHGRSQHTSLILAISSLGPVSRDVPESAMALHPPSQMLPAPGTLAPSMASCHHPRRVTLALQAGECADPCCHMQVHDNEPSLDVSRQAQQGPGRPTQHSFCSYVPAPAVGHLVPSGEAASKHSSSTVEA